MRQWRSAFAVSFLWVLRMKILLIADIHANWPALCAIRESYDACLFLGDLVDYGTDPVPCIDWVRQNATAAVRGNHDHAVAQRVNPLPGGGFRWLAATTRPLQWKVMRQSQFKYLGRLPGSRSVDLDGKRFFLVHATPRDPMDEHLLADAPGWEARTRSVDADFICVGHTHRQFHLDLGRKQVINPGSVGQPRDGDPRCAYAIVENGKISLRRVEYDIDATVRQMREAGLTGEALDVSEYVLRTGGEMPVLALKP